MLFILSLLLVLFSSYFIAGCIKSNRFENSIIYLTLIIISQVIISVEALSVIKQVNLTGMLSINIFIFIASLMIWIRNNKPCIDFSNIKIIKNKIMQAINADKILLILSVFFIFSSLVILFIALIAPSNNGDSMVYHLARIGFWLQNETLAHFETGILRQIVFPINSEILILWPMIFLKNDYFAVLNQYLAYWGSIFVLFSFLSYFRISTRRILWAVFILASLPAVILESMSTQTDLIMAFLLFSSLYLFIYGVKEKENASIVFSAIALGVAIGVKSTVFLFIPAFVIVFLLASIKEKNKYFYKPLALFIGALIPAFVLLSSYNYILNYIDFGNPLGSSAFISMHSSYFGIKAFLANLIRYLFLFIDFTGIKAAEALSLSVINLKDVLFSALNLKNTDGLIFQDLVKINVLIHENLSTFGIFGFSLILPLVFIAGIRKIKFLKNAAFYISLMALVTVIFLITISAVGFCYWYNRFLITAIILSSPVLIYSYTRRISIVKILIVIIAVFNFLMIPVFNSSKPLFWICKNLPVYGFGSLRKEIRLRNEVNIQYPTPYYYLVNYLSKAACDNSKIALIFSDNEWFYPFFEENSTWKIFPLRYEILLKKKNYNDYDFLVISAERQDIDIWKDSLENKKELSEKLIDKTGKIISYDKNTMLYNKIDFSEIPDNFKLAKTIKIKIFDKSTNKEQKYKFYVYKNGIKKEE